MTHEDFDKLVREVEDGVGKDPGKLRRRVTRLAILGYGGILFGLAVVFAFAALFIVPGILWFKDAWGLLIVGGIIALLGTGAYFREAMVRLPKLVGYPISPAQAPTLYQMLDELRAHLNSSRFDQVLIIPDCNAAVVQRPAWGVFGRFKNTLLLGLLLLENCSVEELRSVLAHEFVHLARSHGKSNQWIYRLRRSWEQVLPKLSRPRIRGEVSLRPLIARFVGWFWPRFNAHAFVLSRIYEYEADATAARLAGADVMATALIRTNLCGRLLGQQFWPELWKLAGSESSPPADALQRASKYLTEKLPNSQSWLQMAFLSTTTNADTHPCLSDRLRAIAAAPEPERNYSQRALQPPPTSAALLLLGDSLNEARTGAQEVWRKECAEEWSQQHRKSAALQHRLGGIEQATARAALDADALWDKAQVVSQLEGSQAAVPLLRQILAAQPRHGWANFALGCILLDADDAQGGACLETAFAEDEEFLPNAANALHGYFKRHGQADQIRELYARLDQHEKSVRAGAEERQNVSASDTLIAHDLDAGQLGHLQNEPCRARRNRNRQAGSQVTEVFFQTALLFAVHRTAQAVAPNAEHDERADGCGGADQNGKTSGTRVDFSASPRNAAHCPQNQGDA